MHYCYTIVGILLLFSCQPKSNNQEKHNTKNLEQITKQIFVIRDFDSDFVRKRDVYIRLPKKYNENQSYQVLYMHDGQMLFKDVKTWNKQSWKANEVLNTLEENNKIQPTILVGIANDAEHRHSNYYPQKPFGMLPKVAQDSMYTLKRGNQKLFPIPINSDDYLRFIVQELKPFVDKNYPTKTNAKHTFVAGSSMGGLISMYAFFEHPDTFGGAACLSTHWIGGFNQNQIIPKSFASYLESKKDALANRKLYFDLGNKTLDENYVPHQPKIDSIFLNYSETNYYSRFFADQAHTENDWNKRLHIPFEFLLANE